MSFDEIEVWNGRLDRFDWKLIGKQEMFIPYNANRFLQPKTDAEVITKNHFNPDHMRWELHRVWVVEATLRQGQRHQAPKSRYYCDEDTWVCVLGDRWDAKGQLWKTLWAQTFVAPDLPGNPVGSFGFNDLVSGQGFIGNLLKTVVKFVPPPPGVKSPVMWGKKDYLEEIFGNSVSIAAQSRYFTFRYKSPAHFLDIFRTYYGPTHKAFGAIDAAAQENLKADLLALIEKFNVARDGTLVIPSEYLEIVITP